MRGLLEKESTRPEVRLSQPGKGIIFNDGANWS
jgi:hypothetical protein